MKILSRIKAFTLIELLVVISIIAILASLALPAVMSAVAQGQMTQTMSNMKQLHLVTQQMAMDSTTTGDTNIGWPGDLADKTFKGWATAILGGYMSTNDFAKMMSASGVTAPQNQDPTGLAAGDKKGRALLVYPVSETNTASTVLLTTSNFTNTTTGGAAPKSEALPYGNKGFVVFRKGGDGVVLKANQTGAQYTNIIGANAGAPN
jgi:prepilin-type N-terminal cleavage/methylation domain-containing protein